VQGEQRSRFTGRKLRFQVLVGPPLRFSVAQASQRGGRQSEPIRLGLSGPRAMDADRQGLRNKLPRIEVTENVQGYIRR